MDQPSAAALTAVLQRATALLATDPAAAEREAAGVLQHAPRDPRAALILASAKRRTGDLANALAVLNALAEAFPLAALTQYELGLVLDASGDTASALAALRRAAALGPDQVDTWRALGDLLLRQGETDAADAAFAEVARRSVGDPTLREAASAIHDSRFAEAEAMLRQRLAAAPHHLEALGLLGDVLSRQRRFAEAEVVLARCLELEPRFDGARYGYAVALFRQQKTQAALPHAERLVAADPNQLAYLNLLAGVLAAAGEDARTLALYERMLATHARQPLIWLGYGHALRTVRRTPEAIDAYRRCIALEPAMGEAYRSLADLKVTSFSDEETAALASLVERDDLLAADRQQLAFALGKALEDRGDYSASFASYARGSALRRAETPYDADVETTLVRRSQRLYTPAFFTERAGIGVAAPGPIFVVGLPRSGSTLIEQILASHSQIEGTAELPDIGFIAHGLAPYPDAVADLTATQAEALGEGYLAATLPRRKLGRTLFIDKMPGNFRHVGLIQLILPGARIVDVRRHPLATCFSCFKQHFALGQAFSDDLADLGRYYRDYVELMAHYDAVLPGRVCRVIYEDVVDDLEAQVRRLLDYLGLPFEPACLAFHESDRAVRTISSEQVRRPIFRDGLELWRNFEPWLGPLKGALGPALETWRD